MSGINVIQRTQRLIVDIPTRSVYVIGAGPVGPPGAVSTAQLNAHKTEVYEVVNALEGIISQLNTRIAELEVRVTELEA